MRRYHNDDYYVEYAGLMKPGDTVHWSTNYCKIIENFRSKHDKCILKVKVISNNHAGNPDFRKEVGEIFNLPELDIFKELITKFKWELEHNRVILETPYKGLGTDKEDEFIENVKYSRLCLKDCLERGEAPFASHLIYPEPGATYEDPIFRKRGIAAGFAWREAGKKTVVYIDRGISVGMEEGIKDSIIKNIPVEYRSLLYEGEINEEEQMKIHRRYL